jgi:hypothetical protein
MIDSIGSKDCRAYHPALDKIDVIKVVIDEVLTKLYASEPEFDGENIYEVVCILEDLKKKL